MNKPRNEMKNAIENKTTKNNGASKMIIKGDMNPLKSADAKVRKKTRLKRKKRLQDKKNNVRTVKPTLVVTLGTTAGQIGSQIKGYLEDQGTDSFANFRAFDTDESGQRGAKYGPSFSDNEFCHIQTDQARNVIENPKLHQKIVQRVGLDEPGQSEFHEHLLEEQIEQAGQVRPFGSLCLQSDYPSVVASLKSGINSLKGAYADLEKQLESKNLVKIRQKMTIYVVFSGAGGTGSSMAVEMMALLRKLTKGLSVEIVAVMLMPSCFEDKIDDDLEHVRIQANSYATIQEIDAFRHGFAKLHNVVLGPNDRNATDVPSAFFNQLFVIGRQMANARDLKTLDAVVDATALHLAAIIGTEINDSVETDNSNKASLRGLQPDPITKRSRYVSTLGATSLTLPVDRIARWCSARAGHEYVKNHVLGRKPNPKSARNQVDAWISQPLSGESIGLNADNLSGVLRRHLVKNPTSLIRRLFKVMNGKQRIHFRNSQFPSAADKCVQDFKQTRLPDFESSLAKYEKSLLDDLKKSLSSKIAQLATGLGWRSVVVFCDNLEGEFSKSVAILDEEHADSLAMAKGAFAKAKESATPLGRWHRKLFRTRKRQNLVAGQLQTAMVSAVDGMAKAKAKSVLVALLALVEKHKRKAEKTIVGGERCLKLSKAQFSDSMCGKSITTDSLAEIDISSAQMDAALYEKYQLDSGTITKHLRDRTGKSVAGMLREVAISPDAFEHLLNDLQNYFAGQLDHVSIVDVLAAQLANESTVDDAEARIWQALKIGSQPLWQADAGQNNVSFSGTIIIGVPESGVSKNRKTVVDAIMKATAGRIHANARYRGKASPVVSGDNHRIYVIRRTHGGCFHYLPEVADCELAYQEWVASGGHAVHILNSKLVAKLPSIMPGSDEEGRRAFAIGLAYGWIASRGPHWYWNLNHTQAGHLECRLASHWNSIAFRSGAYQATSGGALDAFVTTGKLIYNARNDMIAADKLGQGLENAQREVVENGEMIELVFEAFDEMRAVSGDARVSEELKAYISDLEQRTKSSDQNFGLVMQMSEMLTRLVAELVNG